MFEVRVTQLIPYYNPDDDDDECMESTGKTETYTAGEFKAAHMAKIFAEALEQKIAEGQNFVVNAYTPRVSIWKVTKEIKEEVIEIGERTKK